MKNIIVISLIFLFGMDSFSTDEWKAKEKVVNETYEITYEGVKEEDVYNGRVKNCFTFRISDKLSEEDASFQFTDYADQIKNATTALDRFLTFNAYSEFNNIGLQYIIDLEKRNIIDILHFQWISFSPSQRYIVYESGYPKLITPDYKKSFLYIYDLYLADEEKPINNNNDQFPPNVVGWPFFPEEYVVTQKIDISPDARRLSPLLWDKEENRCIFVSFNEWDSNNYIVQIDIKKGVAYPRISTNKIDTHSLLITEKMSESNKKEFIDNPNNPFLLLTEEIKWIDSNRIRIVPYLKESWLKGYYDFDLPLQN